MVQLLSWVMVIFILVPAVAPFIGNQIIVSFGLAKHSTKKINVFLGLDKFSHRCLRCIKTHRFDIQSAFKHIVTGHYFEA